MRASGPVLEHKRLGILLPHINGPGKDNIRLTTWRQQHTVFVVQTMENLHWMAVAIFGDEKLVIPFDSANGRYTHPTLRDVSTGFLR